MKRRWSKYILSPQAAGLLAVLVALCCLASSIGPLLQNGDSAVYNDQIDARALGHRSTHFGYLALGMVFRALLPGETDTVMNVMTLLLGCMGIYAAYWLAYKLSASRWASVLSAAALLAAPAYVKGMVLSEVDVPLTAFLLVAFALLLSERTVLAGACYGAALTVSPLAGLTAPAFVLLLGLQRKAKYGWRERARTLLTFAGSSALIYLPLLLLTWNDYWFGGRGVVTAARLPFSLSAQLSRAQRFLLDQGGPLIAFWLLSLALALRARAYGAVAAVLAMLVTITVFGERFSNVPVQLPVVAFSFALCAFAMSTGPRYLRATLGLAFAALTLFRAERALAEVHKDVAHLAAERATYLAIRDSSPYPILLANVRNFQQSRRLERILFGSSQPERALPRNGLRKQCARLARDKTDYAIWFVAPPFKIPCARLKKRYELSKRRVNGARFQLLLPKDRAAP